MADRKFPGRQNPDEAEPGTIRRLSATIWPLWVLAALAILGAMYVARDVLVPIAFAILLALLLRPLLRRAKRLRVPNAISALALVGGIVGLFILGILTLAGQAQTWLAEAPATVQRVRQMVPSRSGPLKQLHQATDAVENLASPEAGDQPVQVEVKSSETAATLLGMSTHFAAAATITFVLGYFLLAFSDTLVAQAVAAQGSFANKRNVVETVQHVEEGISRYLATISIINVGLGMATAAVMWLCGIPNPILWGVLAATANFIPHVGAFLCMVVLFFVGSVAHQSLAAGAGVAAAFIVLTSIESYFITPYVLSRSLQLSPIAVILAILFWGWLWGIGGGLIAAPLLTITKIVCDQFPSQRVLSALLAGEVPNGADDDAPAPATAFANPRASLRSP
jgi:predicted PurR-regulated permease PerM